MGLYEGKTMHDAASPILWASQNWAHVAALPDAEDGDYHTLAGMCIAHFGRIPNVGERFDWAGWRIEVVDLDGARVDKLLLARLGGDDDDAVG